MTSLADDFDVAHRAAADLVLTTLDLGCSPDSLRVVPTPRDWAHVTIVPTAHDDAPIAAVRYQSAIVLDVVRSISLDTLWMLASVENGHAATRRLQHPGAEIVVVWRVDPDHARATLPYLENVVEKLSAAHVAFVTSPRGQGASVQLAADEHVPEPHRYANVLKRVAARLVAAARFTIRREGKGGIIVGGYGRVKRELTAQSFELLAALATERLKNSDGWMSPQELLTTGVVGPHGDPKNALRQAVIRLRKELVDTDVHIEDGPLGRRLSLSPSLIHISDRSGP